MNTNKVLLVIGLVWPEPNSSAAGSRILQLLCLFKEQGYEITFTSAATIGEYSIDLNAMGVKQKAILLNHASFDGFIKELNPTVVLFDRFVIEEQFGWRVAANCPQTVRILDTEDLHCLRLGRQKAIKEQRVFETTDLLLEEVAKREIASILRSDLSLIISEYEHELLQSVFKIDPKLLYYLPFLIESNQIKKQEELNPFEKREHFVFIGNFLHEPNWDCVKYLKHIIWPLIRKQLPDAKLEIYGAYPAQKNLELHNPKEGFFIMGRATDAQEVVKKARVVLAPLRFGAGLKGKLLEAMLCGTPSVTTNMGAEAMNGNLDWSGFVCDEPNDFANAAISLYTDRAIWEQAQQNGLLLVKQRFSKEFFLLDFKNRIENALAHLNEGRKNNFMGSMLLHSTLNSTKYLSKWIEEKNKSKLIS